MAHKVFKNHTCSVCGKPWETSLSIHYKDGKEFCEHDEVSAKGSLESQGRLNIEASKMALHMAAEQKKIDAEMGLNEKIMVNPPPGERKSPFMLSKKVVESIREKVTLELEPLLD